MHHNSADTSATPMRVYDKSFYFHFQCSSECDIRSISVCVTDIISLNTSSMQYKCKWTNRKHNENKTNTTKQIKSAKRKFQNQLAHTTTTKILQWKPYIYKYILWRKISYLFANRSWYGTRAALHRHWAVWLFVISYSVQPFHMKSRFRVCGAKCLYESFVVKIYIDQ